MPDSIHALAGIAGLIAAAWLLGEKRGAVPWRAVGAGLGLQLVMAVIFLKVAAVKLAFLRLNDALLVLEQATQAGTGLVFGYLGGGPAPFQVTDANMNDTVATLVEYGGLDAKAKENPKAFYTNEYLPK